MYGAPTRVWAESVGDEIVALEVPGRPDDRLLDTHAPLYKRTVVRVAGTRTYLLDTGSGTIEVLDRDGRVDMRIGFASPWPEPTPELAERAVQARVQTMAQPVPARMVENIRGITSPGPPPVLRDFVVDGAGRLWIWLDPIVVPEARGWVVRLDPEARSLDHFELPEGFAPLSADQNQLWGVLKDELDIERVYVFGIG